MEHSFLTMSPGVQPPLSQELAATLGPQLLGHVRSLDSGSSTTAVDQAMDALTKLIGVAARQGILQNDIKMAESLLLAATATSASHPTHKKRRTTTATSTDEDRGSTTSDQLGLSTTLPAQLVMTALLRILNIKEQQQNSAVTANHALLVTLAADLIRAVAQHVRADPADCPALCRQAEREWLQGSAKALLTALGQTMSHLVTKSLPSSTLENDVEIREAMASCLNASADLIAMAGTRLSRSQSVLMELEHAAWTSMTCTTLPFTSATTLLATLPLAGGTERTTPALQWTKTFQHVQSLLWKLLQKSVPLSQRINQAAGQDFPTSTVLEKRFEEWWSQLHQQDLQADRVSLLLHLVRSLVSCLVTLLERGQNTTILLEAKVNIPALLDLVDALLSVPMSAEATYHGSKKRLRDELLDSGILTPTSVATLLANHLYMQGQHLLSKIVTLMGAPSLLPFAQRLRQVGYASVLTSCSPTLRQVLEPGYNVARKRRWLPHSLVARTSALRTLQVLTVTLGVKAMSERIKMRRRFTAQEMDLNVKVVCGCLLEQLYPQNDDNLDWGSVREKIDLVVASTACLTSMLLCGGEFLTMETRQLTDSVAASCLSYMRQSTSTNSLRSAALHESFLQLGKACVVTSWPDGAASAIRDELYETAESVSSSGNFCLDQVAESVCRLCDSLSNPTVPALYVITRQKEDPPMLQELVGKMDQVRADTKARAEREQEEEKKRKKAKLEQKQAKEKLTLKKNEEPIKYGTTRDATTVPTTGASPATKQTSKEQIPVRSEVSGDAPSKGSPAVALQDNELQPEQKTDSKLVSKVDSVARKSTLLPKTAEEEESDLDDFPMIVDAGPDEDDMDDDD